MKKRILDYKIKNRYLIYFCITGYLLGSLLSVPLHNIVSATTYSNAIGFEPSTINAQYSDGFLTTKNRTYNYAFCTNIRYRSGPVGTERSYHIQSGGMCWWNLTYSKTNYLTNFSFYNNFRASTTGTQHIYFLNKTTNNGNINNYIARIDIIGGTNEVLFYDSSNSSIQVSISLNKDDDWLNLFYFTITSNLGDAKYGYNKIGFFSSHIQSSVRDTVAIGLNKRIDSIYMDSGLSYSYLDDVIFTISDSYTFGTSGTSLYCGTDVSNYYQIGDIFGNFANDQVNSPEIFKYNNVKRSTQIKGIALRCGIDQYTDDNILSHYSCQVNGVNIGYPLCFSQATNGYDWILFWNCNVNIRNETMAFIFNHTQKTSYGRYWQISVGDYGQDLDGDSISQYFYSTQFQTCGWRLINGIPWWVCSGYTANQIVNKDIAMSFFITNLGTSELFNYPDSLGLSGWDYKNNTGYIFSLGKGITCSYSLGSNFYDYTMELWKNGTQILTTGFPTNVYYPSGTVGYTPLTTGKYIFKLKSTHYVKNITAYVIGLLPNFYIFSTPKITNQYSSYDIIYKYYHQQGYEGYTTLFKSIYNINNFYLNDYSRNIFNNITGNFSYFSTSNSAEYWLLFSNRTYNYVNVGNVHKHFIRLSGITKNTILVIPETISLNTIQLQNYSFTIIGQHTFIGSDVSVYVNGNFIQIVGDNQNYLVSYKPRNYGSFLCELKIDQNGTLLSLCNTSFTVTSSETPNQPQEGFGLSPIIQLAIGITIIIIFTIIPLIVGIVFKVDMNNIPQFFYLIMAVIGFIISIILGFIPSWSIAVLVIIAVLIIIIMWVQRKLV